MMSLVDKTMTLLACSIFVIGCTGSSPDFCQYLSLAEAQTFNTSIVASNMRQTKGLSYCVWGDGNSDKLFISLDPAMDHSPQDFLNVVAKNSPEENQKVVSVSGVGDEAAALFSSDDGPLVLDFLIAQNSEYSIVVRAPEVNSADSLQFRNLKNIAATVLSRIQ